MFRSLRPCLAGLIALLGSTALAQNAQRLLPQQQEKIPAVNAERQAALSRSAPWQAFSEQHGQWSVVWNEATRTPHRAFGPSIAMPKYPRITAGNAPRAAQEFLTEQHRLLHTDLTNLRQVRADHSGSTWYISYAQEYHGLEVLLSEVEVRLSDNGKVLAFGSDVYDSISLSTTPSISRDEARRSAVAGLEIIPDRDRVTDEPKLSILPIRSGTGADCHLVYTFTVRILEPRATYLCLVDAHSGQLLWRSNRARSSGIKGKATGTVPQSLPTDTLESRPFADQHVYVFGETTQTTDSSGMFSLTISSPVNGFAALEGPWTTVIPSTGDPASIWITANPGDSIAIAWDDASSTASERSAFYHINRMHRFLKELDTVSTGWDEPITAIVDMAGACNAVYDGESITYYGSGNGCPRAALCPNISYHEYTHYYVDRFYLLRTMGRLYGMTNDALFEGTADAAACLFEGTPLVARGLRGPGAYERDLRTVLHYPESVTGEVHHDGLFLAGAFWDIAQRTSSAVAEHVWSRAMYGLPDDLDLGVACSEWFIEVLLADDDDGDLGNGTPHFADILAAFNARGIGTGLFLSYSFSHTPLGDTQDTLHAYHSECLFSGSSSLLFPDSVRLRYSLNGGAFTSVAASPLGGLRFSADIPAQPAGTLVQYYFTAYDPPSASSVQLPIGAPAAGLYGFTVGMASLYKDDFEKFAYWLVGDSNDTKTGAVWERAHPEATYADGATLYQPGSAHSGYFCYVTGAYAGLNPGSNDVDSGKTTLISPTFDLRGVTNPVLRYFKWYRNLSSIRPLDRWVVQASPDSGSTWVDIENTDIATRDWEEVQIPLARYIPMTGRVQIRFLASDYGPDNDVEALLDDVEILGIGNPIPIRNAMAPVPPGSVFALSDSLCTVDTTTGIVRAVARPNVPSLRAIVIDPINGFMYGLAPAPFGTAVYVIDSRRAFGLQVSSLSFHGAIAACFAGDTLFVATSSGLVQLNDVRSGLWSPLASFFGASLSAVAVDQQKRVWLIASDSMFNDYFSQYDRTYGDIAVVGRVHTSEPITTMTCDEAGRFLALESPSAGHNRLIRIDPATGSGTVLRELQASGLRSIAFDRRSSVSSVPSAKPEGTPSAFVLMQNYPNPFNPATAIRFAVAAPSLSRGLTEQPSVVSVKVYDLLGREVATLVNEQKLPGTYTVTWNASRFASGIYFYTLHAGGFRETKRMVILK